MHLICGQDNESSISSDVQHATRSNAGIGPNYQAQLDAPLSEPFPKLKQARQPPMLKYEQLADDERYHFTHFSFEYEFTRADLLEDIRERSRSKSPFRIFLNNYFLENLQ